MLLVKFRQLSVELGLQELVFVYFLFLSFFCSIGGQRKSFSIDIFFILRYKYIIEKQK